jgi:hypothetical protein
VLFPDHLEYCPIPTNPVGHCHRGVRPPGFGQVSSVIGGSAASPDSMSSIFCGHPGQVNFLYVEPFKYTILDNFIPPRPRGGGESCIKWEASPRPGKPTQRRTSDRRHFMVSHQGTAQLSRSTALMLCDCEYDQAGVHTLSRGGVNRFGNIYWSSATARLLPGGPNQF